MKSFIAALRTLTLPFGAGPNDESIEVYRAGGILLMVIDDDGLQVFDGDGDLRQQLGAITDFSSILFWDSNGENRGVLTYQAIPGANDYRSMTWQSPDTDMGFGRVLHLSPNNSITKNPMLQWDTGLYDDSGGIGQPIVDLCGFSDAALRAVLAVYDIRQATSNGGGNAPTLGNSYPRGSMGKVTDDTSSAAFSAATTILSGLDNIEVEAGRRYWVHFFARTINQSVALDTFELRIERDAGAGFAVISDGAVQLGTAGENIGPINIWASYDPATDAAVDFRVRGERTGGTGTLAVGASATSEMYLEIADMGSAV
jgi:hypothetical protein